MRFQKKYVLNPFQRLTYMWTRRPPLQASMETHHDVLNIIPIAEEVFYTKQIKMCITVVNNVIEYYIFLFV